MDADVSITEIVEGDESALREFWNVSVAAHRLDAPLVPVQPVEELLAERTDLRSMRRCWWIARVGGQPVGKAQLVLPDLDNTDAAEPLDGSPSAGASFAAAMGAERALDERYREAEQRTTRLGRRWVTTAARHVASGRVVAYTDIGWSSLVDDAAFQWMTIVTAQHRGRRLGMLIKAANLRRLRREAPRVQRVITWNAESNALMVAINEALGFRPQLRFGQWQLKVPT